MLAKKNRMFIVYMLRLVGRGLIFLTIAYLYFFRKSVVSSFVNFRLFSPLTPLHFLWALLMFGMILHLLPKAKITMSGLKSRPHTYQQVPHNRTELLEHVQGMNIRAWKVMLVWLLFNSIFGTLYIFHIINEAELILLTFFYYLSDLVCILIFCPFQSLYMKNRCCVECRIFDWGHFMMYTPMLFIRSFFSWSLFFTACVVLIRWEIVYAKHPERFWGGSNATIRCENCQDHLCQIKGPLLEVVDKIRQEL